MSARRLAVAGGGLATLVAARSVWMDDWGLSTADVSHAQTRLASLDAPASMQENGVRRIPQLISKSDAEAWAAIVRHECRPVPWPKIGDGGDQIDPVAPRHVRESAVGRRHFMISRTENDRALRDKLGRLAAPGTPLGDAVAEYFGVPAKECEPFAGAKECTIALSQLQRPTPENLRCPEVGECEQECEPFAGAKVCTIALSQLQLLDARPDSEHQIWHRDNVQPGLTAIIAHRDNVQPGLTAIIALTEVGGRGPTELLLGSHAHSGADAGIFTPHPPTP
ncbi:hypothetical protein T484DRAFT_1811039 [Baffinella frigidus]|nr:hypothetical protein T484DRAFT_1811039 [Cryptophyta sp. CCMP2293]